MHEHTPHSTDRNGDVLDYQSSPEDYEGVGMMQPRGLNLFNENFNNSKFVDKQPTMDE